MPEYRKNEHYLSNREMFEELMKCQENKEISDKLGNMFTLMANRYATRPNFSSYSYLDEMIDNAIVSCCAAFMKFDSSKGSNTFAYFTSVIHNAFIHVLNRERRHQEIRDTLLIKDGMNPSHSFTERHSGDIEESVINRIYELRGEGTINTSAG